MVFDHRITQLRNGTVAVGVMGSSTHCSMASIVCRLMTRVGIDEYVYGCRLMTRVMISDSEQRCRLYDCEAGMSSVSINHCPEALGVTCESGKCHSLHHCPEALGVTSESLQEQRTWYLIIIGSRSSATALWRLES